MTAISNTAVILSGGFGTRMSELTKRMPKSMVEVNGAPIVVHIMRHFYKFGVNNFILATGYLHEVIEDYFRHYADDGKVVSFSPDGREVVLRQGKPREDWTVTLVNSGLAANTADRVKSVADIVPEYPFFLTYGDCWGDVDLQALYDQHVTSGKALTLTSVPISERYGLVSLADDGLSVTNFAEKASATEKLVNGGFMVLNSEVMGIIPDKDAGDFSRTVLPDLAFSGKVGAYKHYGYWKAVDSVRDLNELQAYADEHESQFYA